jgi:cytochrome b pre-mRNA-processing protein 3
MLDRIAALFSRPQAARQARAERLYAAAAAQSRAPAPFREHGVPDTLDGRFDSLCLHIFLVIRRAGREGGEGATLAQDIYDLLFADMDRTLREMGVGDLGVARRVQEMAEALMGRIKAYGDGLDDPDPAPLDAALRRNLFGTRDGVSDGAVSAMVAYIRACDARIARQSWAEFCAMGPDFEDWGVSR